MTVTIRNAEAERKLRKVAKLMGKTMTATIIELADAKLLELERQKDRKRRLRKIEAIVRRVQALPVLQEGTPDELIGYNKDGVFD